jgi:hypothetical protein
MGHKNTKKHKANHSGYKVKPSRIAVNANLNFWASFKSNKESNEINEAKDELDIIFGKSIEKINKIGIQLKLF